MSSRLVNVRLDAARLDKARRLRDRGVSLSDVVREAIDVRFDAMVRPMEPRAARAAVTRILAAHPDPAGQPVRTYDVHDRLAARRAVARRLARRGR